MTKYKYLGVTITEDGKDDEEIKTRIAMAKSAYYNLERVLKSKNMGIKLRLRIMRCYIWSIVRYASESWIVSKRVEKKVDALEM